MLIYNLSEPVVSSPFLSGVLDGVEDGAAEMDWVVLIGRSEWLEGERSRAVRLRQQARIDGFLVQPPDDVSSSNLAHLTPPGAPIVLMNSHIRARYSSVALDDEAAGAVATDFLINSGHRDIAFIGGPAEWTTAKRREEGYRLALARAGIRRRRAWTTRLGYLPLAGREAMQQLLDLPRQPTAIIVANINAALGALSVLNAAGREVPGSVSVIAIHDTWVAEHTSPPLTTVRLPTYELGREGVRTLARVLDGKPAHQILIKDPAPELHLRQSHGKGPFA